MSEPADRTEARALGSEPDPPPTPIRDRMDVFGDVLPDQTGDERSGRADWRTDEDDPDDRLRREVPPHH